MIPGEALSASLRTDNRWSPVLQRITVQRMMWATVRRLVVFLAVASAASWTLAWIFDDPLPACVTPPSGPGVDYRGFDGAWIWNGNVIGYTQTEDERCLSPTPQG